MRFLIVFAISCAALSKFDPESNLSNLDSRPVPNTELE
jgi:hypothetical protein